MTAVKRKLEIVPIGSPEFDERMRRSDLNDRLEAAARKADLLAWALGGVMALEGTRTFGPCRTPRMSSEPSFGRWPRK